MPRVPPPQITSRSWRSECKVQSHPPGWRWVWTTRRTWGSSGSGGCLDKYCRLRKLGPQQLLLRRISNMQFPNGFTHGWGVDSCHGNQQQNSQTALKISRSNPSLFIAQIGPSLSSFWCTRGGHRICSWNSLKSHMWGIILDEETGAHHWGETFWRQTGPWEACSGTPRKTLSAT